MIVLKCSSWQGKWILFERRCAQFNYRENVWVFLFLVEGCKQKKKKKIICDTLNHVYEDENFDINIQALSATFTRTSNVMRLLLGLA